MLFIVIPNTFERAGMTIIAGIDEAGYGPVMGPLVITVVAFDVPDEKAHGSLWELLKDGVSDSLKDKKNRLCVRDSKKLYHARNGLRALEDAVLSFLQLTDAKAAPSFYQLLDRLSCHDAGAIARYPWYADKDYALPVATSVSSVLNYANLLQYALDRHNVRFHYAGSCVLAVHEFNEQVRQCGNKGTVLFRSCASLIAKLWDAGGDTIHLTIDKQGGRNSYLDPLQEQFPTATFLALEEGGKGFHLRGDKRAKEEDDALVRGKGRGIVHGGGIGFPCSASTPGSCSCVWKISIGCNVCRA